MLSKNNDLDFILNNSVRHRGPLHKAALSEEQSSVDEQEIAVRAEHSLEAYALISVVVVGCRNLTDIFLHFFITLC